MVRLFQPRPVLCGNGIVQAAEQCDDGNSVGGDGCDACLIEPDQETGTESAGSGSDTGGTHGPSGDGCSCSLERVGSAGFGYLAAISLLAVALRPRRPRDSQ
nr:DUF4215 domain-containing protein [Enhygromyxa salina]